MKYTPNYNFKKPDPTDTVNVNDFNASFDLVDDKLGILDKTFEQLTINAGKENAEIVAAHVAANGKVFDKIGDRLNYNDSQLAENANVIYTPSLGTAPSNRPKCAFSTFWHASSSASLMKAQVDNCVGMFDGASHSIYCNYNITTHTIEHRLDSTGTVSDMVNALEYCVEKGISIRVLKVHQKLSDIIADVGFSEAINKYKAFVDVLISMYGHLNPEYITVLNEDYDSYVNPSYETGIISLLDYIRSKGYKAGITFRTDASGGNVPNNIVNACDMFFLNWYPVFSIKNERTTIADIQQAFEQFVLRPFEVLKTLYPTKEIIISEFGVCRNWLALGSPETYYHAIDYPDTVSNIPAYWVFKAFMEFISPYVSEFWIWYYTDTYINSDCKKLFSQFIKF